MNCRSLLTTVAGACVVIAGGFATSGCGEGEGQPSRETISAPRKGGGMEATPVEKGKGAAAPAGKLGGKSGDL
jgi:hypothetical protein